MTKLTVIKEDLHAERVEQADDTPVVGTWYWVSSARETEEIDDAEIAEYESKKYDEPGRKWLACVTEIGSNHAKVVGVRLNARIGIDEFHKRCTLEPDPNAYIDRRVKLYQGNVRELMGEIQRVCALLGVTPRQALQTPPDESNNALSVAHGTENINAHKNALVDEGPAHPEQGFARCDAGLDRDRRETDPYRRAVRGTHRKVRADSKG